MNKLLDLEEIMHVNKSRERDKLNIFEEVLSNCHEQIKRYNKENKDKSCYYSIPLYILGKPAFDPVVLIRYLLHHLRDNGLLAEYIKQSNQIYISWNENDIDIDRYKKRKERIKGKTSLPTESDRRRPPSLMQNSVPSSLRNTNNRGLRRPIADKDNAGAGGNVLLDGELPVNRDKYKQAKRIQRSRERKFEDNVQKQSIKPQSYSEFMKSMF